MLDLLFNPSSIAIIGASNNPMKAGGRFLKALIEDGFKGKIYPVNPKSSDIMGLTSFRSLRDIPGEVDLAILNLPSQSTLDAISDCAAKRVKFAIVHTAGFGETGSEGKNIESRIVEIAQTGNTRIVGPNCMGIYNPDAKINMIMPYFGADNLKGGRGSIAFFGQSGWASETFILEGYERGLQFSKIISIGNQCDITIAEYLKYFLKDSKTKVVAGYMEGVLNGKEFLQAASLASKKKPLIIWKSGKSGPGAKAASSHTGSLAGSDKIFDAAFRQAGIIRADNLYELMDFVVAFTCPYRPLGRRVGILVEAGGGAVAAADACAANDLEVPPLPSESQAALRQYISQLGSPVPSTLNPVDIVWPPPQVYSQIVTRCLELLFKEYDAVIWITYSPLTDEDFVSTAARIADKARKPLFTVTTYPTMMSKFLGIYTAKGVPTFQSPERAVKALSALVQYST